MKNETTLWRLLRHLLLLAASLVTAFPFFWMASSALKTNDEIWLFPPVLWPSHPVWRNFADAWNAAPFERYLLNSVGVALAIVFIQLINSAMMAYAFSHMKFVLNKPLMAIIMVSYMLPVAATYLPGYIIISELHLLDTYTGLIISNAVSVFSIFLARQAFMQLPKEIVEAAKIDGASHWRILWSMAVPLSKSTFIVMSILTFIGQYNNYFWPMLITKSPEVSLISAGLRSFFVEGGAYGLKWPLIMASSTFSVLPLIVLFVAAQKWIIKGVNNSFGVNKG